MARAGSVTGVVNFDALLPSGPINKSPDASIAKGDASGTSARALLTILAQRPTKSAPSASTSIKYNGQDATPAIAAAVATICYADDAHDGFETVYEAVESSCYLRAHGSPVSGTGSTGAVVTTNAAPAAERQAIIESVLVACELKAHSNRQLKDLPSSVMMRVRIAVELASKPSVLLVETAASADFRNDISGLRALMRTLRRAADAGVAVLVSLPCPTAETSAACDSVIIMSGPRTLASGLAPSSSSLSLQAVAASQLALSSDDAPTGSKTIVVVPVPAQQQDDSKSAHVNPLYSQAHAATSSSSAANYDHTAAIVPQTTPRKSFLVQWAFIQRRLIRESWRNVPVNFGRQMIFLVMGLFVGLLFLNINDADLRGSNAKSAIVFFLCTTGSITVFSSIAGHQLAKARPWVYRERAALYYHPESYSFSQIADVPWILLSSLFFNILPYAMAGLDWSVFGFHILIHAMLCLAFGFFGHFTSGVAPNAALGGFINLCFISFNVLLAGTFVANALLPEYMKWINQAVPMAWAGRGIIMNAFWCDGAPSVANAALKTGCVSFTAQVLPGYPVRPWDRYEYFATRWNSSYDDRWDYVIYLAIFIAVYRVAAIGVWRVCWWGRAKV